ncbi:MAG: hypothetical protein H6711_10875 [Myxococcales bacterium]|nr:hypothetical protein [Myxococcales bacterium]
MSRYVHVATHLRALDEVVAGLRELGLEPEVAEIPQGLALAGSLECAGEPVDLRLPPGALGSVEDFGWRREEDGALTLICGEPDRAHLDRHLLGPLRQAIARARVRQAAGAAGLEVDEERASDGSIHLKVRQR